MRAIAALLLLAASVPLVWSIKFSGRPEAALPQRSAEARDFAELSQRLARHEVVLFVLRGGDAGAAPDLAKRIADRPEFKSTLTRFDKADGSRLLSEILALWPPEREAELDRHFSLEAMGERIKQLQHTAALPGGSALLRAATVDPLGLLPDLFSTMQGSGLAIDVTSGYLATGGATLMLAMPSFPSHDPATPALFTALCDLRRDFVAAHPGAELEMTGPHLFSAEYKQRLEHGLLRSGLLSVALLVLVAYALYRDLIAMVLIGATLAAASVWTLALSGLVLGDLQVLAVSAASILPAVGIDAGVQFYAHLRRSQGSFPERLLAAERAVRRPLLIASLASALGFAAFITAEVRAFVQFGAMLTIGVVANLAAMWLVLPPLLRLAHRLGYEMPSEPAPGLIERAGAAMGRFSHWQRALVLAIFVVPLILAFRTPKLDFGFQALLEPTLVATHGQRAFEKAFGASSQHLFVSTCLENEDAAFVAERTFVDRVQASPLAASVRVEATSPIWVTETQRARAVVRATRLRPNAAADTFAVMLDQAGFAAEPFAPGLSVLRQSATTLETPHFAQFFHDLRVDGGCVLTSIFVRSGDPAEIDRGLRAYLGPHMVLSGPALIDRVLQKALRGDLLRLSLLALGGVGLAILLSGLSWRRRGVAMLSLLVLLALTTIVTGALQFPITLITLLVFPFVLGIGIDATIYLLEHHSFGENNVALLEEHLRPLLGSTVTTLMGFLALLVVPLTAIRELGILVASGLALALLVALLFVPLFGGPAKK